MLRDNSAGKTGATDVIDWSTDQCTYPEYKKDIHQVSSPLTDQHEFTCLENKKAIHHVFSLTNDNQYTCFVVDYLWLSTTKSSKMYHLH